MIDTRRARAAALFVLLAALVGGFVWYGTLSPDPADGRYPHLDDLDRPLERYVGTQVVVDGRVIRTDPPVVEADYTAVRDGEFESGTVTFTVTGVSATPAVGDHVQVYGVLESPRTIHAFAVVVVPARNLAVMFLLSFVAGLWTLGRLVRGWRLDRSRFAVVPRRTPLAIDDIARRTGRTEDEADA